MTAYLYHRLSLTRLVPRETLVRALGRSRVRCTSLCEALVALDVAHARAIHDAVAGLGEPADEGWRPDRRLLMDLPPGICERYLAFPYRERAGKVEFATVCGTDEAVRREFEFHLNRPVVLYRARLQALLAAAHAPIDLDALSRFLSQPPPPTDGMALPLVRKNETKVPGRRRIPTSPGMGKNGGRYPESFDEEPGRTSPGVGELTVPKMPTPPVSLVAATERQPYRADAAELGADRLETCRDVFEMAAVLGQVLPAPALVFEHAQERLYLRITSGPGTYQDEVASLKTDSGFQRAARDGSYQGPFFECDAHARYYASFPKNSAVLISRLGSADKGLMVACSGEFEVGRVRRLLDIAQQTALHFH